MKKSNIVLFLILYIPFLGITQINANTNIKDSIENEINNNLNNGNIKKNTIYLELFGNGVFYSIGYERTLVEKNYKGFSLASGFTYFPVPRGDKNILISPQILYTTGSKYHRLELGLGYTINFQYIEYANEHIEHIHYKDHYIFYRIGYRYRKDLKNNQKIYGKIAFTPFTLKGKSLEALILPSIGLAVCRTF